MKTPCHYCLLEKAENPFPFQLFTVHDGRGCLHVCWKHAAWRHTTSTGRGHGQDCPLREDRDNLVK